MLNRTRARALIACAVAAIGSVTAMGPASAAKFVAGFDPLFGLTYPGLGFRGEATFFIPDTCLAYTGVITASTDALGCAGSDMQMLSARVEFYDDNSALVLNPLTGIYEHPTVVAADYLSPPLGVVESALIAFDSLTGLNQLVGVNTLAVGPEAVASSLYTGPVWLEFITDFGDAPLWGPPSPPPCERDDAKKNKKNNKGKKNGKDRECDQNNGDGEGHDHHHDDEHGDGHGHDHDEDESESGRGLGPYRYNGTDPAYIYLCPPTVVGCSLGGATRSNPAIVTFARVPEPSPLALMLPALLAGLLVRRKSTKAD